MDNVLKIWLKRLSGPDFILVDTRKETFVGSHGPNGSIQILKVGIECLRPRRNPRVVGGDSKLVFRPVIVETNEFDASVGIEINQVPIGRAVGGRANIPLPRCSS